MKRANFLSTIFSKSMLRHTTYQLALTAVFTALVLLSTMVIAIPIPATGGFVNIGDTLIFVGAVLFGPFVGGIAGGLGAMLADLILGYSFYAPFTFCIKLLEGAICGFLGCIVAQKCKKIPLRYAFQFVVMVLSACIMVAGYFFVELGYFGAGGAVAGLTGNIIQAAVAVALSSAILFFYKLGERVVRTSLPQKFAKTPENAENIAENIEGNQLPPEAVTEQDAEQKSAATPLPQGKEAESKLTDVGAKEPEQK